MNLFKSIFGAKPKTESVQAQIISPFVYGILKSIKEEPSEWESKCYTGGGSYLYHKKTKLTLDRLLSSLHEGYFLRTSAFQTLTKDESNAIFEQFSNYVTIPNRNRAQREWEEEKALAVAQERDYFEKLAENQNGTKK